MMIMRAIAVVATVESTVLVVMETDGAESTVAGIVMVEVTTYATMIIADINSIECNQPIKVSI